MYKSVLPVMDECIRRVMTPRDVSSTLFSLLGPHANQRLRRPGVLHVTSVVARGEALMTLRVHDGGPKSIVDFFVLNACRAAVDSVIATGQILREETRLTGNIVGPFAPALKAWRTQELGRARLPTKLVLTRGDVDPRHVYFTASESPVVVFTPETAMASVCARFGGGWDQPRTIAAAWHSTSCRHVPSTASSLTVVSAQETGISGALAFLQHIGCAAVSVEAGPHTTHELYEAKAVDTLVLSEFKGPTSICADVIDPGPSCRLSWPLVAQSMDCVSEVTVGDWVFRLLMRRGWNVKASS